MLAGAFRDLAPSDDSAGSKTQRGVQIIAGSFFLGIIAVSWALTRAVDDPTEGMDGRGAGLSAFVVFAAAAAVGSGTGFLFGLPRARFVEEEVKRSAGQVGDQSDNPTQGTGTALPRNVHYLTNSNLIKVSDWLTTIIVGVTLVNLGKVGTFLTDLQQRLIEPLGGTTYSGTIGISLVIVGALTGAMLSYMWTTLRLRELLEKSEADLNGDGKTGAKDSVRRSIAPV